MQLQAKEPRDLPAIPTARERSREQTFLPNGTSEVCHPLPAQKGRGNRLLTLGGREEGAPALGPHPPTPLGWRCPEPHGHPRRLAACLSQAHHHLPSCPPLPQGIRDDRTADCGLRTADCRLRTADCWEGLAQQLNSHFGTRPVAD